MLIVLNSSYAKQYQGAIVQPAATLNGHCDAPAVTTCTGDALWLVETVEQLEGVPYEPSETVGQVSADLFMTITLELLYLRLKDGSVPKSSASPSGW